MTPLGCSFTGHRSVAQAHIEPLKALLVRAIAYAYDEGCRTFYTGGAVGFDTMAARAVLRFRLLHADVRLVLLLPCPEQDANFDEREKAAYAFLLEQADEIRYVCESYTRNCMMRRNAALASLGDLLIAYAGRARSGSSQTLRMAKENGKRVYNLYTEAVRIAAQR